MLSIKSYMAAITIATSVTACAQSGTKIDQAELHKLQPGVTTVEETIARLGRPTTNTFLADGRRMIQYIHTESQVRPETLIPIAGAFVGGADTTMTNVTLVFDQNGILRRSGSGESYIPTEMGPRSE